MRHQLRHGPVGVAIVGQRQALRSRASLTHGRRLDQHFQLQVECAALAQCGSIQVGQRLRIVGRTGPGATIRGQRFQRDDPGRDGGGETLGQERPQRLVFPGLHVTGRPVIEEAQPEHLVFGLAHRNRLAQGIATADEDAHFQFVIQALAGSEAGRFGIRRLGLADRAAELLARDRNRRRTTVVADRHPFIVGQQRVVRTEELAHRGGVVDGGIEVGVVTNGGRHIVAGLGLRHQAGRQFGLVRRAGAQQARKRKAQRRPGCRGQGHQGIERAAAAGGVGGLPRGFVKAGKGTCRLRRRQVQDLVTDGDACTEAFFTFSTAEHTIRQVLDREWTAVGVGALDPAAQLGVVGFVQFQARQAHARSGLKFFWIPSQQSW